MLLPTSSKTTLDIAAQLRSRTFLIFLVGWLIAGLAPQTARAVNLSHIDQSLEKHVLYLQSEGKIDYYESCSPNQESCETYSTDIEFHKFHREKTVHIVNLTGQAIDFFTTWIDYGSDGIEGSTAGNAMFSEWNVASYAFDPTEDTFYTWPSAGTFLRQDIVEAGTTYTMHELVESLFFVYSTTWCEEGDHNAGCISTRDDQYGVNAFAINTNLWSLAYGCGDGAVGGFSWLEDGSDVFTLFGDTFLGPRDTAAYIVFGEGACESDENVYLVEGDVATDWLDRDDPGNDGDFEILQGHTVDGTTIPDYLVGVEPAYVEMRRGSDEVDVRDTGESFELRTNLGGIVDGSDDYHIKFHYGWTPWLDRDNPEGSGDYEGDYHYTEWSRPTAQFPGRMPQRNPTRIQCRSIDHPELIFTRDTADGVDVIEGYLGGVEGLVLFWCNTTHGYKCINDYNTDRGYPSCHGLDVEVRYFFGHEPICDGNLLDGMDDGWCNATAGEAKIVARWDSGLCLNAQGTYRTSEGTNVNLRPCENVVESWRFNLETGKIHAAWDDTLCVNAWGDRVSKSGALVDLYDCDSVTETWTYDEATGKIHAGWDSDFCLDANGDLPSSKSNVDIGNCDEVLETWDIEYE